jgi:hypothetical protein
LVSVRAIVVSAIGCVLLVLAVAWLTDLSLARAALLAPVLVVGVGAGVGLVVFWGRVAYASLRRRD